MLYRVCVCVTTSFYMQRPHAYAMDLSTALLDAVLDDHAKNAIVVQHLGLACKYVEDATAINSPLRLVARHARKLVRRIKHVNINAARCVLKVPTILLEACEQSNWNITYEIVEMLLYVLRLVHLTNGFLSVDLKTGKIETTELQLMEYGNNQDVIDFVATYFNQRVGHIPLEANRISDCLEVNNCYTTRTGDKFLFVFPLELLLYLKICTDVRQYKELMAGLYSHEYEFCRYMISAVITSVMVEDPAQAQGVGTMTPNTAEIINNIEFF
jgi:hypothetical protein